ncbi:MAG: MlaD family protein [Solirubrobacteraceae bacterium]|nr:MlaD family protein [Solirubrobacteraceae bacterium]
MSAPTRRRKDATRWYPLIGIIGIVGLLFVVYVSYTANDGVPGRSYREFRVAVPDANRMVVNNQVRIAGVRVGQIMDIEPVPGVDGKAPSAMLDVKLDLDAPEIPIDTRAKVRPASILGATYLDLVPGRSDRTLEEGGTLPLEQASRNVELTDLLDVFDTRTSRALQTALTEIGGTLVGRGAALGQTFAELSDVLPALQSVSRMLAAPDTRLAAFIDRYQRALAAFAAVRPQMGRMLSGGATTFAAIDRSRDALGRTIDEFPATARQARGTLARLRPALDGLADIAVALRPAADVLPGAVAQTNSLFTDTRPWLRATPEVGRNLTAAAQSLQAFSSAPETEGAIRRLGDVVVASEPLLEAVTDAQVHCNFITLFGKGWHNVFGTIGSGQGPSVGNVQFSQLGTSPLELLQNAEPLPNLHMNYTPNANENECESGNEPWHDDQRLLVNPPGHQSKVTETTTVDPAVIERARRAGLLQTPPPGID